MKNDGKRIDSILHVIESREGFGGKSSSDVRLTMHTLAALRRTEQNVRCPEWRLRAQAGVSLACFCCFLCIIFPAQLQSVPGQTVLVCLENPLLGSRKPCRAQKAPHIPLTMFSFPLQPNQMCPYITVPWAASPPPKCSIRPHPLSCPTQMVLAN